MSSLEIEGEFASSSNVSFYEVQTAWAVLKQMTPSFVTAGFASVFAGIVLHMVTDWAVFEAVSFRF